MNLLSDILTYVRRIIKSPSNAQISDNLLIDYINRFWIMDVDARMQLFDLKTKYQFQTIPGIYQYNMPLYDVQVEPGSQNINYYPVYQGFMSPVLVNGIVTPFYTERGQFTSLWPTYTQPLTPVATGDGLTSSFTLNLPFFPALPGHLDMAGIIATGNNQDPQFTTTISTSIPYTSFYPAVWFTYTDADGNNVTVHDSGVFLSGSNGGELYGLLMVAGSYPFGYSVFGTYSTTQNTVNYNTGVANVTFPSVPPANTPIQAQCLFFQPGIPRGMLYNNNTLTMLPPPNTQYMVELDAYLTPAAFLATTQAVPFGYMSEYIARGAARKILSDTGDWEQFQAYEPLFKEQETLVWKRSQRQFTSTRVPTIFSQFPFQSGISSNVSGT